MLGQTNTPWVSIIDKDGTLPNLRVMGMGDTADIISVTKSKERENPYSRMFNGMDPSHEMEPLLFNVLVESILYLNPEPYRLKNLRGQIERLGAEKFLAGQRPFFIPDDPLRHFNPSLADNKLVFWPASGDLDDFSFLLR